MSRFKGLAKEGSWIVAGQIAVVAASLVLVRVLTEYLDPAQYGQLALALTLGTLIGQIAFSGSLPGIMRYYSIAAEKGEAGEYFQASLRMMGYGILVALALSTLLLMGLPLFGKADMLGLISLTIIFTILGTFNTAQSTIQNAARQRTIVALHGSLDAWLRVAFAAGLLAWLGNSAKMVIVGYISSLIVVLFSQAFFIRRLIPPKEVGSEKSKLWATQIWQYSKPFLYFNAFTWVQVSADRWALDTYATSHEVGLYVVLLQLGSTPIGMIAGMMTTLISPILFQQSGDTADALRNSTVHKQAWQITAIAVASTLLACIFAYLFHEWIFRLLVTAQYRTVSYLLPWMILAGGLFAAGQMLSLKLMSDLNTQALVWPKIITSLVGAALSFVSAYFAGLTGVIFAAVAFSVVHLLWLGWLSRYPIGQNKG
jgi:O-antigen/teichoic acid export membrane protein